MFERVDIISSFNIDEREITDFMEEYIELGENYIAHRELYTVSWKDDNGIPKTSPVNRRRKFLKSKINGLTRFDEKDDKSYRVTIWIQSDQYIAIAFSTAEEADALFEKLDKWLFEEHV